MTTKYMIQYRENYLGTTCFLLCRKETYQTMKQYLQSSCFVTIHATWIIKPKQKSKTKTHDNA